MATRKSKRPLLILVCGGTASGKTTVAKHIVNILPKNLSSTLVCLDSYYKNDLANIKQNKTHTNINFDHPSSFDWLEIVSAIRDLLNREAIKVPIYDYVHSRRSNKFKIVKPVDVIVVEGIYALYSKQINDMADLKVFVDTPDDERFIRRLLRDKKERGRTDIDIATQWRTVVQPMFKQFIENQSANANLIIPWQETNKIAIHALKGAVIEIFKKYK